MERLGDEQKEPEKIEKLYKNIKKEAKNELLQEKDVMIEKDHLEILDKLLQGEYKKDFLNNFRNLLLTKLRAKYQEHNKHPELIDKQEATKETDSASKQKSNGSNVFKKLDSKIHNVLRDLNVKKGWQDVRRIADTIMVCRAQFNILAGEMSLFEINLFDNYQCKLLFMYLFDDR